MNKILKIILIILLVIISIFIVLLPIKKFFVKKPKIENLKIIKSQNEYDKKYLIMTEEDFNLLDIATRWNYRTECLNHFNNFSFEYNLKKYRYPLPKSENNGLIFVNLASYRDPECHKTVKSLIFNSNNWKNLRICVCEQNSTLLENCKLMV